MKLKCRTKQQQQKIIPIQFFQFVVLFSCVSLIFRSFVIVSVCNSILMSKMYSHQMVARALTLTYTYHNKRVRFDAGCCCLFSCIQINLITIFVESIFFSVYLRRRTDLQIIKIAGAQRHITYKSIEWCRRYMLKTLCTFISKPLMCLFAAQWMYTRCFLCASIHRCYGSFFPRCLHRMWDFSFFIFLMHHGVIVDTELNIVQRRAHTHTHIKNGFMWRMEWLCKRMSNECHPRMNSGTMNLKH